MDKRGFVVDGLLVVNSCVVDVFWLELEVKLLVVDRIDCGASVVAD